MRDLARPHGAVGVDHDDVLAGGGGEAGAQGVALARSPLGDAAHGGQAVPGHRDGRVAGGAVDQDDLVDAVRDLLEDPGDVAGLVAGGDDQADGPTGDDDVPGPAHRPGVGGVGPGVAVGGPSQRVTVAAVMAVLAVVVAGTVRAVLAVVAVGSGARGRGGAHRKPASRRRGGGRGTGRTVGRRERRGPWL